MNRRDFLLGGSALGLTLSNGNLCFGNTKDATKDTAVLYLFLSGGATHIETFNPIPNAPSDRRSITGYVNTNVAGMQFGGLFKELAKHGKKITNFHSFHHRDANHDSAQHWVMTGEANFGAGTTQNWPSYGSVASGFHGTNAPNGLPTYIKVNGLRHDDAAWMGGKYTGYDATREGRKDLQLLGKDSKFHNRLKLLSVIEKNYKGNEHQIAKSWNDLKEQAVNVILGEASRAFKIEQDREYDDYKDTTFGKDIITAVRLIESGTKFVTLNYGGWDMHNGIEDSLNNRQTVLDNYLSKLIMTLEKRGLYEKVMLVVTSEFGRTPKINGNAGRDHWARLIPLIISNGSYDMGRVIGKSNANAEEASEKPIQPEDLRWTIFDHLGIDKRMSWTAIDGRPHQMVKEGAKNILTEI